MSDSGSSGTVIAILVCVLFVLPALALGIWLIVAHFQLKAQGSHYPVAGFYCVEGSEKFLGQCRKLPLVTTWAGPNARSITITMTTDTISLGFGNETFPYTARQEGSRLLLTPIGSTPNPNAPALWLDLEKGRGGVTGVEAARLIRSNGTTSPAPEELAWLITGEENGRGYYATQKTGDANPMAIMVVVTPTHLILASLDRPTDRTQLTYTRDGSMITGNIGSLILTYNVDKGRIVLLPTAESQERASKIVLTPGSNLSDEDKAWLASTAYVL